MKQLKFARNLILLTAELFECNCCMSQKLVKEFNDCLNTTVYMVYNGDSIVLKCDTAFILNKNTFRVYQKYYDKVRSGNDSYTGVIDTYEKIINAQDSMLINKENYFQDLKLKFDSLSGKTLVVMDNTSNSLHEMSVELNKTTAGLVETQKLLADAQKILAAERRKINLKVFKFALGGIAVGALVAALIVSH